LPASQKAKDKLNTKRQGDDKPRKDDVFAEGYTWAEFNLHDAVVNKEQVKASFDKPDQIWHYLGKTSTDARAQYTEDPSNSRYNPKGNFLDTIPKPPKPAPVPKSYQYRPDVAAPGTQQHNGTYTSPYMSQNGQLGRPYMYKPKYPAVPQATPALYTAQRFPPTQAGMFQQYVPPGQSQSSSAHHSQQSARTYLNSGHTAAAPAQQKPAYQMHSSVYQKYQFFQVHHNRDPSRYRTPYAPYGGFTNGYEGNLRAHLTANQNALLHQHAATSAYGSSYFADSQNTAKPQYMPPTQANKAKPKPQPKAYKVGAPNTCIYLYLANCNLQIPEKESPVPLPANFLAALMSSPNTPHGPKNSPPQNNTSAGSPKSETIPSAGTKTSATPVPLPNFAKAALGQQNSSNGQNGSPTQQDRQQPLSTAAPVQSSVPIGNHRQEFADVPGRESMEFVENMMLNLRRASLQGEES
jgi:hypothetical protein